MWFWTHWALHTCYVNAWIYPSSSMSLSWWCHVWSALLRFKKLFRETVFSLPTPARHRAANVLKDLDSLRLRQWLGNWFEAFLWHRILLSKESDCGKVIGLDHALLLLRCSGLSQHCAQGAKGARLWMKAAGPESVFHVAAMIAPWFKSSSWSVHKSCRLLPVHAVCVWWESDAWLLHFVGHGRVPWGHFLQYCARPWGLAASVRWFFPAVPASRPRHQRG